MPYLIRRISRAKWDEIEGGEVSADAITNDLKTFQNDLSVWLISNREELDRAVLALVTGGKQTKLSTLHIILIEEEMIENNGLTLKETPGDTVVASLVNSHSKRLDN